MNLRKIILILLISILAIVSQSISGNFCFKYRAKNEVIRRIRGSIKPSTFYGLCLAIYARYGQEEFSREDIMQDFGWSYQTVHYKLNFLTEIGILQREGSGRGPGGGYRYRFKSPFDERENLELLAAIKELHEIAYHSWPEELVTTIKGKIETILDAKQNINIELSDDLEPEASNLRTKFLISVCYRGLPELYKSFSNIKISRGDSIDIFYDKSNDEVLITLTDEEINKAISQDFWDLFGEEVPVLRVKLIDRFLAAYVGYTEEDIDLIHISLTILGDLYGNWYNRYKENEEFIPYVPYLVEIRSRYREESRSIFCPLEHLLPIEQFIANRNEPFTVANSLFSGFLNNFKELVQKFAQFLNGEKPINESEWFVQGQSRGVHPIWITPKEKEVLILRYGINPYTIPQIAEILEIDDTNVRARLANILSKLRDQSSYAREELQPYILAMEGLFRIFYDRWSIIIP